MLTLAFKLQPPYLYTSSPMAGPLCDDVRIREQNLFLSHHKTWVRARGGFQEQIVYETVRSCFCVMSVFLWCFWSERCQLKDFLPLCLQLPLWFCFQSFFHSLQGLNHIATATKDNILALCIFVQSQDSFKERSKRKTIFSRSKQNEFEPLLLHIICINVFLHTSIFWINDFTLLSLKPT